MPYIRLYIYINNNSIVDLASRMQKQRGEKNVKTRRKPARYLKNTVSKDPVNPRCQNVELMGRSNSLEINTRINISCKIQIV